jgi:hypothetical protein
MHFFVKLQVWDNKGKKENTAEISTHFEIA